MQLVQRPQPVEYNENTYYFFDVQEDGSIRNFTEEELTQLSDMVPQFSYALKKTIPRAMIYTTSIAGNQFILRVPKGADTESIRNFVGYIIVSVAISEDSETAQMRAHTARS